MKDRTEELVEIIETAAAELAETARDRVSRDRIDQGKAHSLASPIGKMIIEEQHEASFVEGLLVAALESTMGRMALDLAKAAAGKDGGDSLGGDSLGRDSYEIPALHREVAASRRTVAKLQRLEERSEQVDAPLPTTRKKSS